LNWKEIHKNYPRAYGEYIDFHHVEDCPSSGCYDHKDRDLYDFFDEQEIKIEIIISHGFDAAIFRGCECYPYVKENRELAIIARDKRGKFGPSHFKTRTEAEEAAFEKAFEILEKKLK